jgi:hypothetical protein
MGLVSDVIMGLITAVLLSVLITTEAYAQTPTANNTNTTTGAAAANNATTGGLTPEAQRAIEEYLNRPRGADAATPTSPPPPTTTTTTTDPELQKFDQIANDCKAVIQRMYPGAQTTEDVFMVQPTQTTTSADYDKMRSCNQLLSQAIVQYCNNLQTYDATRCAYVDTPETDLLIGMTYLIEGSEFLFSPEGFGGGILGR